MKKINFSETNINTVCNTKQEIWGQPVLWEKVHKKVQVNKKSLEQFLEKALSPHNLQIILTGAGTSAFIGLSLTGTYYRITKKHTSAISTTDLVTHPLDYLNNVDPVLLISFARSGNSPESVAAVKIADEVCSKVYHLIISCDKTGDLANYATSSEKYVFVLPDEANDKGLAMTGSYSGMLLAGLLIAHIQDLEKLDSKVKTLVHYGEKLLNQEKLFNSIAGMNFERAVFLGSGPMFGTATESHLKLQELTDGTIICKKDSFLGFRHGPKAVINNKTLVVMFLSNQLYVNPYEEDLIESLNDGQKPLFTLGITESEKPEINLDHLIVLSDGSENLEEEFLPVCYILIAQMIAYFKSAILGLNPDSPSESGAINRVVKGVNIYPFQK